MDNMPYNPPPNGVMPDFQLGTVHNKETDKWHVLIVESCEEHGAHHYVSNESYNTEKEAEVAVVKEREHLAQHLTDRDGHPPVVVTAAPQSQYYTPPASKHNPHNN